MELTGKRATIVGLAREGVDLAHYLVGQGARVTITDEKPQGQLGDFLALVSDLPVELVLGGHPLDRTLEADVLFASPGVPPTAPIVVEARARGIPVSSATALLFERCPAPIVGITGSSGKTTTTALVGEIFRADDRRTWVGGNIGRPLLRHLDEMRPTDWVIVELSSFQLEPMGSSPRIAAITNITANHLDRHGDMASYTNAKLRIVSHQGDGDWAVTNADDPASAEVKPPAGHLRFSLHGSVEGAYLAGPELRARRGDVDTPICSADQVPLFGRHNLANALAASAVACAASVPVAAIQRGIIAFRPVPHRLETVGEHDGTRFVNDSIATAPERSIAALEAFANESIILLAGGKGKNLPLQDWAALIARRVRHLITFGDMGPEVGAAALVAGMDPAGMHAVSTLNQAVDVAIRISRPGDVVLLSPGGTSYDQYRDFEERGRHFAHLVRELKGPVVR
jgi:UDP-N-acetylmuramoylalanine--D-glutamate ligase